MMAVPFPLAVTSPAAETVAISVSDELHVTAASATTVPPASFTVAVIVAVSANDAKLRVVGDSVTDPDACAMLTAAVAVAEPDVAVIVAVPFKTPVTNPAVETVAIVVSDELQVTVGLAIVLSLASFTRGVSVAVSPNDTRLSVVGDNVTELGT
jgi:hypothetical protein